MVSIQGENSEKLMLSQWKVPQNPDSLQSTIKSWYKMMVDRIWWWIEYDDLFRKEVEFENIHGYCLRNTYSVDLPYI